MDSRLIEVIATYFVNCHWHHLYETALTHYGEGKFNSLQEAYRVDVTIFNTAFCEKDRPGRSDYVKIMSAVGSQFDYFTGESHTYDQFIDCIAKSLLPKERYTQLQSRQKHEIVTEIMRKTVTAFSAFAIKDPDVLKSDVRSKAKESMKQWREKFIELLTNEMNAFCSLLLAEESKVDLGNPTVSPTIPVEVCDRLKMHIRDLLAEKARITTLYNNLVQYVTELKKIIAEQESEITKLKAESAQNHPADQIQSPQDFQDSETQDSQQEDMLAVLDYEPLTSSE